MNNLRVNIQEVKRFFNASWPGQEDGFLFISSNGQAGLSSKFFKHPLGDGLLNTIERWSGRNVWFTIGLIGKRPEKGRGTASDVVGIPGLWSDIDCLGGTHKETCLPSRDQALELLSEFPFKPSVLVWSGGGFQPYWLFQQPWIFETKVEWEQAKEISRRWQGFIIARAKEHGWKIDNVSSIEHLLRVPGTFNHKAEPVPVEIVEMNDFRYNPEAFLEFLDDIPQDEPKSAGPDVERGRIHEIIERCHFLRHCRDDAASLPEPSWFCMTCALCFVGGSRPIIHELSKNYPGYTGRETDEKILEAMKQTGPMTCRAIQETTGFECPSGGCGVKCPVHLMNGQKFEWEEPVLLDDFSLPEMEPLPGIIGEFSQAVSVSAETPLELAQGLAIGDGGDSLPGSFYRPG